ncbi:phage portal protein [Mycolicibacterium smegmatis]|uniref:phage portal protein n=1 Tax=Mycolicibacterium smegmatis TaxID=1772 RepID=UPI001EFA6DFD|nr:phage portal protein [Mycolicibacterium smegmatis]ULN33617.1 phage portal protein [Mycolicibacterium smegmatis]
MTDDDLLITLVRKLDERQGMYRDLNLYARGEQPLAFLAPEARAALNNRFGRIASNIPRLAVQSIAERLRITGFQAVAVWDVWIDQDMEELAQVAIKEALTLGQSFLLVWADDAGNPTISVESAEQCCVLRNPADRSVVAGLKRYRTDTETHCYVYMPDEIRHYVSGSPSASTGGFNRVDVIPNPLGVVPMVPLTNSDRLLDEDGYSEITDLKCLVDGLNAALAGLAVALEYSARPRRWATGLELREEPRRDQDGNVVVDPDTGEPIMDTVNPIEETARMAVSENEETKFGQWQGADLAGYKEAVDIWLQQILAVSSLSPHMVGITTENPSSADAIRSAESSLTARASGKQHSFGRAFEQVIRLVVAVRDGVDPASVHPRVVWADPSTRSPAAEADMAVKLYQSGILSRTGVLKRLGLSADEIAEELAASTNEAMAVADARMANMASEMGMIRQKAA